jgi:hypothetical protein
LGETGEQVSASSAAVIWFAGGTPELVQFTQGLEKQGRQRYVVALAVVRNYRQVLAKLFDEPPTPHSLAGFIAARSTHEVIRGLEGATTRTNVLQAFSRRQDFTGECYAWQTL